MKLVPFKPITADDDITLSLVQQQLLDVLQPLTSNALMTGHLQKVTFPSANTDVMVTHGLMTTSVQYFVCSQSAGGTVFFSPSKATTSTQVTLQSTVPMTCRIYFFQAV